MFPHPHTCKYISGLTIDWCRLRTGSSAVTNEYDDVCKVMYFIHNKYMNINVNKRNVTGFFIKYTIVWKTPA